MLWTVAVNFNGRRGIITQSLRVLVGAQIRTTFTTEALDRYNRVYGKPFVTTSPPRGFSSATVAPTWRPFFRGREYWLRWYLTVWARGVPHVIWRSEAVQSPQFFCGHAPFADPRTRATCYFVAPS